ncbi:Oxysterol-binding protein-domain-containing protein [Powellomyces hirtus]|nr:Oxysterol-binding protein-domain-containing protein [Powellomyces hirtus]
MSTPGSANWKAVDESVRHVQLIDALRSHDIAAISDVVQHLPSTAADAPIPAYGSPLHLAIALCPTPVIQNLVSAFPALATTWANTQSPKDGETALHLASKLGRPDIIEVLFKIKGIKDSLRDGRGRTAEQVASSERVRQLIIDHRIEFAAKVISKVRHHLVDGPPQGAIDAFIQDPRASAYLALGWIGINDPIDPDSEQSFLHFAAKADHLTLVEWALQNGADPAVKDRKGRKPADLCPKHSKTKNRLKTAIPQAPIISGSLPQATSSTLGAQPSAAPSQKGVLLKWINYASGYKSRYFVLDHGSLSYYKSATDYPLACRGSISTMIASVVMPDSSDKSRFDVIGRGSVKYSLKARSPADAKKWVWALMESKKFMVDGAKEDTTSNANRSSVSGDWGSGDEGDDMADSDSVTHRDGKTASDANSFRESVESSTAGIVTNPSLVSFKNGLQPSVGKPLQDSEDELALILNLLNVQMDVQRQVVETLVGALANGDLPVANSSVSNIPSALHSSSKGVSETVAKLVERCLARERLWAKRWKKERDIRQRWEEVVQKVLNDEAAGAHGTARPFPDSDSHQESSFFSTKSIATDEEDEDDDDEEEDDEVFYDAEEATFGTVQRNGDKLSGLVRQETTASMMTAGTRYLMSPADLKQSATGYPALDNLRTSIPIDLSKPKPSLAVWSFLKSAIGKDLSKVTLPVFFNEPLSMLQRMCEDIEYVELLSLASAVGRGTEEKSTPPSQAAKLAASTLGLDIQRLSAMGDEEASLVRLMYVGAYAMSNYSSTLGRVQKPFNPVLGETYELVREDKGYRYLSEQVCHHPPISACHCESPDYTFWTEVNVKSKFWGKSLEIHPLGACHVRLPLYKPGSPEIVDTEHFTWKKVTTSVNNVIVGKLWIDHYGDMVVKNWRTGEECTITFKPKATGGWFGLGAKNKGAAAEQEDNGGGEISGVVKDAKGHVKYELQGRWDGEVTAVPVGGGGRKPLPLWKRNPMPNNAADNFFFTSFATTLNQLPSTLRANLPLTDSRLRPDQQAMERGDWDVANTLKEQLEFLQRTRRKDIVAEYERTHTPSGPAPRGIDIGERWWTPRWFVREIDPDSNEEHWRFDEQYWKHRNAPSPVWPEWVLDVFGVKDEGQTPIKSA